MGRWGLILVVVATSAHAETFNERWPNYVPDPLEASVWPKLEKQEKEKKVKRPKFVCHKQYYMKRGYRYWRCKR